MASAFRLDARLRQTVRGLAQALGRASIAPIALQLVGLLSAAPAAQQQPPAQQPPPTLRSGTQVVEVDVRVFDKDSHFVTDLRPEDFEIREDGVPQAIGSVALVGLPSPQGGSGTAVSAALSAPAAPSVTAASSAPAVPSTPATWVFLFDTTHLSPAGLNRTRDAVKAFVHDRFGPGYLAGMVADGKMVNNRLTTDRDEIEKALDSIKVPGTAARIQLEMKREWPRLQDEYEVWRIADRNDAEAIRMAVARACDDDPIQCANADLALRSKARALLTAIGHESLLTLSVADTLSHGLARMPGPKTVVLFSEGFPLWGLDTQLRESVGQANRAGAHVYAIDARGMNKGHNADMLFTMQPEDSGTQLAGFDEQVDGPNSLAVDTGGLMIRNENNLDRALAAVQRDAGTYYVLGYTPSNQTFDGKYRAISVTVKRDGVKVRARRGYLAIEPAKMLRATTLAASKDPTYPSAPGSKNAIAAPPATSAPPAEPAAAKSAVPAGSPESVKSAAPAEPAAALRSRIDARGFVQQLLEKSEPPGPGADAAAQGWAAYQRGDVVNAAAYLGRAAESPDAHPWVSYALGLSHLALEHYADAVRAWEHVRREVPEFEPVYFNLADGYLLQKDDGAALKVLRDAQKHWPDDAEVWNAIGVIHVRRGALDTAIESFERATTVAPADSLGFFNLARAYQMRSAKSHRFDSTMQKWVGGENDRKKAEQHYERYIQMGGPYVQQAKDALAVLAWQG